MTNSPHLTLAALHGNGGGAFRFERVRPHIPPAIDFHALTLPGFARLPADPSLRTMRDYAQHLRRLLQDRPRPLVLLGHGIGGAIALELAQITPPGELQGLILHAPVGARLERRLFPRLMALPGARTFGQWLFSAKITRPLFKRLLFSQPVPAAYLDRFFEEYRHCQVFGQMFDLISPAWFNRLQPVDCPAVLLWGERERVLTVDQLEDFQTLLPRHTVRTVPNWDHFPMIEQPAEYAREIVTLAQELITHAKKKQTRPPKDQTIHLPPQQNSG